MALGTTRLSHFKVKVKPSVLDDILLIRRPLKLTCSMRYIISDPIMDINYKKSLNSTITPSHQLGQRSLARIIGMKVKTKIARYVISTDSTAYLCNKSLGGGEKREKTRTRKRRGGEEWLILRLKGTHLSAVEIA